MTFEEFIAEWNNRLDYVEAHTSGSTGTPKRIRLLKSDMLASAHATNTFFSLGENDIFLCPLSADYIAGKMMAVRAIAAKGKVYFVEPSNTPQFIACNLLAIVPSQVDALLCSSTLPNIKNVIIGGAALSSTNRDALIHARVNAFETYGMTETCSHIALKHIADSDFTAMPNVSICCDSRGCLVLDIPYLSVGRIITNDVVEITSDKTFRWLGRFDNIINSGGIKIVPEQLENEIRTLLSSAISKSVPSEGLRHIPEFYITARKDPKWGERVVLIIEENESPNHINEILKKIDSKRRPKEIITISSLPRTANNKLRRLSPEQLGY